MAEIRYEQVIPLASESGQDERVILDPYAYDDAEARSFCWCPQSRVIRGSVRESPRFLTPRDDMLGRRSSMHISPDNDCSRRFEFVRTNWFLGFSGLVLLTNIVVILLEIVYPENQDMWWWFDQAYLTFYVLELLCRIFHFQGNLLMDCSSCDVLYNWLDVVLVVLSVYDQWMVPFLAEENNGPQGISTWLRALRVLRFLRVLRLVRVLLEADTSWAEGPAFQSFIACVILANALMMGLETDYKWGGWFYFEQLILFVFFFELCVQLKHHGMCSYLIGEGFLWNWLDLVIVLGGILDQWVFPLIDLLSEDVDGGANINLVSKFMMLMRMLRLLRILRLLRLVKTVRPLYTLAQGVLAAMQGMFWVLVLTSMTLYAFAILATKLIGHGLLFTLIEGNLIEDKAEMIDGIKAVFGTVSGSMFVLFQVMNGKENILEPLFKVIPYMKVMFVIFMVLTSWALLSILTAVLSENMIMVTQKQDKEAREHDERSKLEQARAKVEALFKELDSDGSNYLDEEEFITLLDSRSEELQSLVKLSEAEIYEVFEYLSVSGEVRPQDFVDGLLSLSMSIENQQPVSERSVMRLERRMRGLTNDISEIKDLLQFQAIQKVITSTGNAEDGVPRHVTLRKNFKEFRQSRMHLGRQSQKSIKLKSGRVIDLDKEGSVQKNPLLKRSESKMSTFNSEGLPGGSKSSGQQEGSESAERENSSAYGGSQLSKGQMEDKPAEHSSQSAQPSAMGQPEANTQSPVASSSLTLIDLEPPEPSTDSRWGPCCGQQTPANVYTVDPSRV